MTLQIEYADRFIEWEVSAAVDVAGMQTAPPAVAMPDAVWDALERPIQSPGLSSIAEGKIAENVTATAVIVVSDNTRPVPYFGKAGLIYPIVRTLIGAGFTESQITILIGAGSHRNMDDEEIESMIGLKSMGLSGIKVSNHEYDDRELLVSLGATRQGSQVWINKMYYEADLKIVTGLVESHFMAGASGGRKGICPGIVGKETLTIFHGANFLSSQQATDLAFEGNPLHEEASEVAAMAGCDFLVNVTIDANKAVTGVFAGELFAAHQQAVAKIRTYVTVPLTKQYDIVIIPAGFVGINHYQGAKAAVEASRAVRPGGKIIIVAKNGDADPVGGKGYKEALKLLHKHGNLGFMQKISHPDWQIIQEQWQVQMWCKVLDVIGSEENLYYCALEIPADDYDYLPGRPAILYLQAHEQLLPPEEAIQLMLTRSLDHAIESTAAANPTVLLLKDGPYGIPVVEKQSS